LVASAIVRPRADWVRVLEAAYEPAADDPTWGREVVGAMRQLFRCNDAVGMQIVEHDPGCLAGRSLVNLGMGPTAELGPMSSRSSRACAA